MTDETLAELGAELRYHLQALAERIESACGVEVPLTYPCAVCGGELRTKQDFATGRCCACNRAYYHYRRAAKPPVATRGVWEAARRAKLAKKENLKGVSDERS